MGGSTADTPTTPESLRASDAERDHAVGELRNEFAEGRLSHETFMYRMQSALDARHRGQLAGMADGLRTDRFNFRSQQAIARLGATKEGVLRHHGVRKDGSARDTVMYSVLAHEWPDVRRNLELRMVRPPR